MNANIRSALVGGLAATFVVAASFAPRMVSDDRADVTMRQAASDAIVEEPTSTTLETTSTTVAATTTTTAALESRVTRVEERVTIIEKTTTTTMPKPTTPNVEFYFEEPAGRFGRDASQWAIVFRPSATRVLPVDFPNLRVRATVNTLSGLQEFIAEPTPTIDGQSVGNIVAFVDRSLLDPAVAGEGTMSRPAPTYLEAATVEWDGGSHPALRCC